MKIKRSNLVTYPWKNCLNTTLIPMLPKYNGWVEMNGELIPQWFEGDPLPSEEEYDSHIEDLLHCEEDDTEEDDSDKPDSDMDTDSDLEYPSSVGETSSDETDGEDYGDIEGFMKKIEVSMIIILIV